MSKTILNINNWKVHKSAFSSSKYPANISEADIKILISEKVA